MSNRSHQEPRGAIWSQQETIRAARRQQETKMSNRSHQEPRGAIRSQQETIRAARRQQEIIGANRRQDKQQEPLGAKKSHQEAIGNNKSNEEAIGDDRKQQEQIEGNRSQEEPIGANKSQIEANTRENEKIVEKTSNLSRKASHFVFSEPFWGALGPLGSRKQQYSYCMGALSSPCVSCK